MAVVQTPVRFLTTPDGVRIAVTSHGSGPPIVLVRGWVSHLDFLWQRPAFRTYWEAIAESFTLVRYDTRGNGLSDRDVGDLSLEALVMDLATVVEGLHLESAVLYGTSFGGPIALQYTSQHPQRVSKLVLDGTYANGSEIAPPGRLATILAMFRNTPEIAGVAMGIATRPEAIAVPTRNTDRNWESISPEVAARLYETGFTLDVTSALPLILVPALVMHRRESQVFPLALARRLASQLADARFVALAGANHETWEGDIGPPLAALSDFLGVSIRLPDSVTGSADAPLVVLFTDITGSVSLTQRLGDELAQTILHAHNDAVRRALTAYGGTEVKHTGDGIMASFGSATRAIAAGQAIREAVLGHQQENPELPFAVKVGINAGEPVREDKDLFGTAVQLARRLCDTADANEVLVSSVVRELAAGKGFTFEDRGEVPLKGFEEPVRIFALR